MISDTAVMAAWVEFAKAQAEGIHDPRSMRRALKAAEKCMVPTAPAKAVTDDGFCLHGFAGRCKLCELTATLARSEANAQMWFDLVEKRGKALRDSQAEVDRLRLEVEVLRQYGNKDCTAMADAALEQKRETGKGPWED